ncbi:MAG: hypothetical protein Q7U75_05085, partial [Desulfobacterales bacterium]|nr:hypothetical protein [Desulfobacterales bacterium]
YPTITGPLPLGTFSLTLQGGTAGIADATRYLGTIKAGSYLPVYWLVTYPTLDIANKAVYGGSSSADDLWLNYDVWATGSQAGPTTASKTQRVYMRSEISSSANQITPNNANQVPSEYLGLISVNTPTWTNSLASVPPGATITTLGAWFSLGNVAGGFFDPVTGLPQQDLWLQPVGDAALFDAGTFRLVHTEATLIVERKDGTIQVITGMDDLYFDFLPDSTHISGYVQYTFMGMNGAATVTITPYQTAASGSDTVKFCSDYGTGGPSSLPLTSIQPQVTLNKTASVATVSAGGSILYGITFTNTGAVAAGAASNGVPIVVRERIPSGLTYVTNSALTNNSFPTGVTNYT